MKNNTVDDDRWESLPPTTAACDGGSVHAESSPDTCVFGAPSVRPNASVAGMPARISLRAQAIVESLRPAALALSTSPGPFAPVAGTAMFEDDSEVSDVGVFRRSAILRAQGGELPPGVPPFDSVGREARRDGGLAGSHAARARARGADHARRDRGDRLALMGPAGDTRDRRRGGHASLRGDLRLGVGGTALRARGASATGEREEREHAEGRGGGVLRSAVRDGASRASAASREGLRLCGGVAVGLRRGDDLDARAG